MDDELRDRLAGAMNGAFDSDMDYQVFTTDMRAPEIFGHMVDAVLAEIGRMHRLVEHGLLQRLVNDAGACDYDCQLSRAEWEMVRQWRGDG